MTAGDEELVALGATRYDFRPDVGRIVQHVLTRYPQLTANTYICHFRCGWRHVSVDFWGPGGRGDAGPHQQLVAVRRLLFNMAPPPLIRHTILEHQLWTSFGGWSYWAPNDHSGKLRHLHVTYWR